MPNALSELTTAQLERALELRKQIDALQSELGALEGTASVAPSRGRGRPKGKGGMSAAGRARIAAAARARWARLRKEGKAGAVTSAGKGKRKMTAAWRAKIAAAARSRWAKAKASGRNRL